MKLEAVDIANDDTVPIDPRPEANGFAAFHPMGIYKSHVSRGSDLTRQLQSLAACAFGVIVECGSLLPLSSAKLASPNQSASKLAHSTGQGSETISDGCSCKNRRTGAGGVLCVLV